MASDPNPLPPDKSLGGVFLVLTCVLTALSIATTVLRVWARYGRKVLGWDDYAITVCTLLAIARTIIQIVSVKHGNGRHKWYISEADYQYVNFLTWLTQIFLFTNICLLKCAICLLILRIKNEKVLRWCLYAMMGGLVATNFECIIVLLAECNPPKKYWIPDAPGECWNTKVRIYSIYLQVAYSVITDLICTMLPIVVLWNIKIAPRLKFAVCGLMSLGLIATATAIVRASSLGTSSSDLSYDYCIAAIWANTELHIGIIATNLSLSRMIYGYFAGHARNLTSGSRSFSTPRYGGGSRYAGGSRHSRHGYIKSQDATNESFGDRENQQMPRRPSEVDSQTSEIPLDPVIKKTTSFYITSEESEKSNDNVIPDRRWNSSPTIETGGVTRKSSKRMLSKG